MVLKKEQYRYILVVIDKFSKFGWTVPVESKSAQTITNFFENTLIIPKRKRNLIETDCGKESLSKIFTDF